MVKNPQCNLAVLEAIVTSRAGCARLAALTGRKEASLSLTLKRFAQLGIVAHAGENTCAV